MEFQANDNYLRGKRVVLLDIEGTTTPITFVKDTMFSYIRTNLINYIETNFDTDELQMDIAELRNQAAMDVSSGVKEVVQIPIVDGVSASRDDVVKAVVRNVLQQMDIDRKTTSLKQLQGHMWRTAFQCGQIRGQVYDDVYIALKRLQSLNISVYIYSSGSVEAQKLLFGHSSHGDLLQYISGHFDTNVGPKTNPESYSKIVDHVQRSANEVLFLTDIPAEAAAAVSAGLSAGIVVRPGNAPIGENDRKLYSVLNTFDDLFQTSCTL